MFPIFLAVCTTCLQMVSAQPPPGGKPTGYKVDDKCAFTTYYVFTQPTEPVLHPCFLGRCPWDRQVQHALLLPKTRRRVRETYGQVRLTFDHEEQKMYLRQIGVE